MRLDIIASILIFACLSASGQNLKTLPLNEIRAGGWMKQQMERDIAEGYISEYENMQPSMKYDAFGPEKTRNYTLDSLGNWISSMATWWPGEHEGYFADLAIRNAFLTGNEEWKEKAKEILDRVLEFQEKDGYIGIYKEDCRLDKLVNDNGELWTQSRILTALLAYYEYTGEERYLTAVKRAADLTMERYVTTGKSYFQHERKSGGGITHGLMYVDVLEWLYRLTGDERYVEFAEWLYLDYSRATNLKQIDMQLPRLLNPDLMYFDHSVHVAEHMRVPLFLASVRDDGKYKKAVHNMLMKYRAAQAPSGVLVMDPVIHESVACNFGSPYLPYEYCTIVESVISFSSAMQKSGAACFGDEIEKIAFNAGQGARLPDGSAISYATIDNRRKAMEKDGFRYQVAACHKVACCNLQAPKLIPYYVANMWMKSEDGNKLYATLYGESSVTTEMAGQKVCITEKTMYPFDSRICFGIETDKPVEFALMLRNPHWSDSTVVKSEGAEITRLDNGYIEVSKKWRSGDTVEVIFDDSIAVRRYRNNELYITRGALMYAMDVRYSKTATMEFEEGFANFDVTPSDTAESATVFEKTFLPNNIDIKFGKNPSLYKYEANPEANKEHPFDKPYGYVSGRFILDGKPAECRLVPMGSTVLRKVTFREYGKQE